MRSTPILLRARRIPALLATALLACAASDTATPGPSLEKCLEPRLPMCTREYRPVCGHRCLKPPCPEEQRRTYSNACTACADPEVAAFSRGSCETGTDAPPVPLR